MQGDEEGAAVEDVRGMRRGNSNKKQQKDTPWGGLTYCSAWRVGGSFLSIRGGFGYHKNKSKFASHTILRLGIASKIPLLSLL